MLTSPPILARINCEASKLSNKLHSMTRCHFANNRFSIDDYWDKVYPWFCRNIVSNNTFKITENRKRSIVCKNTAAMTVMASSRTFTRCPSCCWPGLANLNVQVTQMPNLQHNSFRWSFVASLFFVHHLVTAMQTANSYVKTKCSHRGGNCTIQF